MDSVLYSWLGAAAVAPFVVILSCWTLAVFRTYRTDWRLLDIFLYALTCLEVASALFGFGYAILGAIRPALEAPCRFMVWGLTATRIFHLSSVTSLLLDRALASSWPRSYRSNVRQSQVRYHIIVLAIISIFVGVTSVFARSPSAMNTCSLHPLDWDFKFSAFLACVYGLLIITGLVCCLAVQASRFRSKTSYRTNSCSRESATSHGSSCEDTRDLEWVVVASICWLSYIVNHGPFLVMTVLGMAKPSFWTPWMDNSVVWLRLVQGLMVPCVLLLADMPHRSALRNMLRHSGKFYRHLGDHGGFRMQIGESTKPTFPPYPPYHAAPFPQRLRWSPTTHLPSLQSLQPLDLDSMHKGYGSAGYTTLLSMSSSANSFPSPFSSCSSAGQSLNSVTTNAVNDFVFRRPSVMALFEPELSKTRNRQAQDQAQTENANHLYKSRIDCPIYQNASADRQNYQIQQQSPETQRRCDTPTPFIEQSVDGFVCNCRHKDLKTASSNMINIILAYDDTPSIAPDSLEVEANATNISVEDPYEKGSYSSESSDADSVQSVIIRQRVDQKGRVLSSDISRVEKKLFKCDRNGESDANATSDSAVAEHRILYSEYL